MKSREMDQEWLQLFNWQKSFCEKQGISEWAFATFDLQKHYCIL